MRKQHHAPPCIGSSQRLVHLSILQYSRPLPGPPCWSSGTHAPDKFTEEPSLPACQPRPTSIAVHQTTTTEVPAVPGTGGTPPLVPLSFPTHHIPPSSPLSSSSSSFTRGHTFAPLWPSLQGLRERDPTKKSLFPSLLQLLRTPGFCGPSESLPCLAVCPDYLIPPLHQGTELTALVSLHAAPLDLNDLLVPVMIVNQFWVTCHEPLLLPPPLPRRIYKS
ncbi:hypothetical protein TOPH_07385 [Tolypocladium ophioglossoides CBS 100239]|uniref:Uncharacterized protein n=1 Tax=Tolypocladium ophioglossoides (strain CBS 100239) TaxID=1163406 RepID=A0A0L0N2J6_TOLOC|nr:hypothetical protein TOPH_07385 [Tolypocladium ophioglossoides CBS 100239]